MSLKVTENCHFQILETGELIYFSGGLIRVVSLMNDMTYVASGKHFQSCPDFSTHKLAHGGSSDWPSCVNHSPFKGLLSIYDFILNPYP